MEYKNGDTETTKKRKEGVLTITFKSKENFVHDLHVQNFTCIKFFRFRVYSFSSKGRKEV